MSRCAISQSFLVVGILLAGGMFLPIADAEEKLTPSALKELDTAVLTDQTASERERMLQEDSRTRLRDANRRESEAWRRIDSRAEWEAYRDERTAALRKSLGVSSPVPKPLPIKTTGVLKGEDYRIEKIVFESRPGLWVTANLYQPEKVGDSMPGILICHSHHNPKTQSELQDMGIMWARAGCVVLVMDQLGHGERRQHPFASEDDYKGSFRVGRQDYYFRYNVAAQLHLVGESLVGWMAWDMMRGVDLLLSRPGVDPKRILLLGAVAGGGDPAAVTAAIDPRITGAVPFNFGGPQPETGKLGDDAETTFNYAGSGSWESTRNLRLSARDGFLPWVIVGSIAPRGLVYAHEFTWDQEHDPVWKRLQKIYGFYDAGDRLSSVHGYGAVTLSSGQASHCNNIGPAHRKGIHEAFRKWFKIPLPDEAFRDRRPAEELHCLKGDVGKEVKLTPVHELANQRAEENLRAVRNELHRMTPANQRKHLRERWQKTLGDVEPYQPKIANQSAETQTGVRIEKFVMTGERQIRVPVLLLIPSATKERKPVTVLVAQAGKDRLLKERAETIAALLENDVAVCLPDLRGIGETQPGSGRSRQSWATSLSASEQMLGQSMLGSRLKDLRSLLSYLRSREEIDPGHVAVWGDSLAEANAADRNLNIPYGADESPDLAEPGGPLLALFAGLFDEDVSAVVLARGGLVSWQSILESPFLYVPHDAIVPGALLASDLNDIAAALASRHLWISGLVDGRNRKASESTVNRIYARAAHQDPQRDPARLQIHAGEPDLTAEIVPWLVKALR